MTNEVLAYLKAIAEYHRIADQTYALQEIKRRRRCE
mgnify:FL=1